MNNSSFDKNFLSEEERKSIVFMSEKEKQQLVKYDSNGTPLYYNGEDEWIPVSAFVSKEEILKAKSRYIRPRIYPLRIILSILTPILLGTLINFVIYAILSASGIVWELEKFIIVFFAFLAFYLLLNITNITVFAIQLYQLFAKDETRERCGLTPTCSTYAIIALKKYGFIIGMIKAIKRLHRCDGDPGEDWP